VKESITTIPEFNGYFPSEAGMNNEQQAFYQRVQRSLKKGDFIDVKGNIGYVFVYLYKILNQHKTRGFNNLFEFFIYISEIYLYEKKLSDYCKCWAYDCLIGLNKYDEYLEKTEPKEITGTNTHGSSLRLNIQYKLGMKANPIDILLMCGGRKTKFITNNSALYKKNVIKCINDYQKGKEEWFSMLSPLNKDISGITYPHYLFAGASIRNTPTMNFETIPYYTNSENIKTVKLLSKEAENVARKEIGVPMIGEGWVSETELFRKIEKAFPMTKVIQHGQPSWLGRQHFDIWIPHWNIAIEYHGEQHFRPIDFFGGEKSFIQTVERDKRKIRISNEQGVTLFVVTKDDNQDELINKIKERLSLRRLVLPDDI
jgi:hypothetical protein